MKEHTGIYAHSRAQILEHFEDRISGSKSGLFLVLHDDNLCDSARNALIKSAQSLGWGDDGVTFACTSNLEDHDLFELVEGFDPVALVVAGPASAKGFFSAYRIEPTNHPSFRAFCRETRMVPNIEAQIESQEGKQQIWAALKTLPRP